MVFESKCAVNDVLVSGFVEKIYFDDALDFGGIGMEVGLFWEPGDKWIYNIIAGPDIKCAKLSDHLWKIGMNSDFFKGFAEGSVLKIGIRFFGFATGKAYLS